METIKILLGIVIIAIGIFSPGIIYAIWVMDKIKNIEENEENEENNDKVVDKVNWENKLLKKENKQLQERIEYLERSNNRREDTILEQRQEISDLEDNWNKLKEIAKSQSGFKKRVDLKGGLWFEIDDLLDKIQELEQGSDNQ